MVFSLLGIVAGSLVLAKPKPAGILLIIASVGGLIAVFVAYIIAFPLLLVSGILGLVGAKNKRAA